MTVQATLKSNIPKILDLINYSKKIDDFMSSDNAIDEQSLRVILSNKNTILLIEQDSHKNFKGFLLLQRKRNAEMHHTASIQAVRVMPECRGNGIGHKLLEQVVMWCKKHKVNIVTVDVVASNSYARKLYKNNGFKKYGVIRDGFIKSDIAHDIESYILYIS